MPDWPAWYRTIEPNRGTCYVPHYDFPAAIARHNKHGQAWKYNGRYTTYCPNRRVTFKALDRLGVEDEKEFWSLVAAVKQAGISPPTSYANVFLSCYRAPMPRVSPRSHFYGFRFGGWQEAFRRGESHRTVYQYDLNKAYRWAASCGLPDLRSARRTWDFDSPCAVYLVSGLRPGAIPYRRVPAESYHMVTSEERDALALDLRRATVHVGVSFTRTCSLVETFEALDRRFPVSVVARVSRAFWGMWNTTTAPEVVSWTKGERSRTMKNPWYNPIWSAFITSRVKLRLNLHRARMLHCFVDSLHVTDQLPTGTEPGDWKLVGEYKRFWCRAPGQWGDGDYTMKWTGRGSIVLSPVGPRK